MNFSMELIELRESLQDEVITYMGIYDNQIPCVFTEGIQVSITDDICDIIVKKVKEKLPMRSSDSLTDKALLS